jgi:Zn-dependent protease with chaperone function
LSEGLGFFQLGALALAVFAVGIAALSAFAFRAFRGRLSRVSPALRARFLGAWAAAPLVGAALLTVVCLVPDQLGMFGIEDHCLEHPGHHHFCLAHDAFPMGAMSWAGLAAVVAVIGAALALHLPAALKTRRTLASLRALARQDRFAGVSVVPSARPFAATLGLARPAVFLSSALVSAVDGAVLEVIRAHESSHLRRRDPLRLAIARVVSLLHLPSTRRALLADLSLACEHAADQEAAAIVGDPLRVARALLAVERTLKDASPLLAGVGFASGHLSARVRALAATPAATMGPAARLGLLLVISATTALGLVLAARPLHHATETVLTWITR